jgi:hypothetical protein
MKLGLKIGYGVGQLAEGAKAAAENLKTLKIKVSVIDIR